MPNNIVKSFAEKSKKSEEEVDDLFKKAEGIVKSQYKDIEVGSDKFYQLVTGVLKKMLGINETPVTTVADVPKHYTINDLDSVNKRKKLQSESVLIRLDGYLK